MEIIKSDLRTANDKRGLLSKDYKDFACFDKSYDVKKFLTEHYRVEYPENFIPAPLIEYAIRYVSGWITDNHQIIAFKDIICVVKISVETTINIYISKQMPIKYREYMRETRKEYGDKIPCINFSNIKPKIKIMFYID